MQTLNLGQTKHLSQKIQKSKRLFIFEIQLLWFEFLSHTLRALFQVKTHIGNCCLISGVQHQYHKEQYRPRLMSLSAFLSYKYTCTHTRGLLVKWEEERSVSLSKIYDSCVTVDYSIMSNPWEYLQCTIMEKHLEHFIYGWLQLLDG